MELQLCLKGKGTLFILKIILAIAGFLAIIVGLFFLYMHKEGVNVGLDKTALHYCLPLGVALLLIAGFLHYYMP